MSCKKSVLQLTLAERQELEVVVGRGKSAAWKIQRANALLKCGQSEGGPAWANERIAEAFGMTTRSLENWRKTAVGQGQLAALERRPRPVAATAFKLDGEQQARLVKLAC